MHELLERLDFARPVVPRLRRSPPCSRPTARRRATTVVADLSGMVEGFGASEMRERLAGARRVRTELPFVYSLDGVLVNGVVDVHAEEDDGLLVVDYKSDPVEGLDLEAYCAERYATQRLVYALARCARARERVEVAYVFLERPG